MEMEMSKAPWRMMATLAERFLLRVLIFLLSVYFFFKKMQ